MGLKLAKRKGRPHYFIRGTVRNQAVFETTGTDDYQAAEAIRIKRENELLNRSVFGAGATLTFLEAAASYVDFGGKRGELSDAMKKMIWALANRFGSTPLRKIDQPAIDLAAREMHPKAGPATRKRHVYVPMSAVMHHAERVADYKAPRLKYPGCPATELDWSEPERLEELLPHLSPALRRFVILITYTGMRLSEALFLDWDRNVILPRCTIFLPKTKNDDARSVYLPEPVLIEFAAVPEAERTGRVFVQWKYPRSVRRALEKACARAGVKYLPPHQQGRHTFATWMMRAGADLVSLQKAVGWRSIASAARYAHVTPGDVARLADRLPSVPNQCQHSVIIGKPLRRQGNSN